jgi:chemotaxis protein MotB
MKKKHPEHVNHERWLVSYADFITLLFAFFVVLFASGQSDKRKQVMLAHSMQSAFDHNGIFDPHSKSPPINEEANAVKDAVASPLGLPLPSLSSAPGNPNGAKDTGKDGVKPAIGASTQAERIKEVVKEQLLKRQLPVGIISVHTTVDGTVVSLREAGFFASGSADLRIESIGLLNTIIASLPDQPIRVEGHTDNVPIHTAQFATNWELSTARAATITRLLITQNAVTPTKISAAGYAEFRPIADNATEQGRSQNRRVDIVLLKPADPEPEQKSVTPSAHKNP